MLDAFRSHFNFVQLAELATRQIHQNTCRHQVLSKQKEETLATTFGHSSRAV